VDGEGQQAAELEVVHADAAAADAGQRRVLEAHQFRPAELPPLGRVVVIVVVLTGLPGEEGWPDDGVSTRLLGDGARRLVQVLVGVLVAREVGDGQEERVVARGGRVGADFLGGCGSGGQQPQQG